MITDEERREVAEKLRELPIDVYDAEEQWKHEGIDTECHDQTDYYLIHQALLGCLPAEHMHPCDYEELHARLADLIEPEPERTCCLKYDAMHGDYTCSSCGEWLDTAIYDACDANDCIVFKPYRYCPNCGAKVVEQ